MCCVFMGVDISMLILGFTFFQLIHFLYATHVLKILYNF